MSKLPLSVAKAAIYLRKSREDLEAEKRGENTLLKQKNQILKDVIPRYTFDYDIYEEVVSGESIEGRPEFKKLLAKLESGHYQAIVVKEVSRLGRGDYKDMGVVYDLIRDKNIYIITPENVLDPSNYDDLFLIRISMFMSREEYERTVYRLKNGKYQGAKNGKWVAGSVPFGMTYNSKTQKLEENPEEAKVIRLIFDMYINENLGCRAISTKLKRMGIRSPKGREVWQPLQIMRILQNRAYKGDIVFKKTRRAKSNINKIISQPEEQWIIYEDAHESIIDENVWQKAQERLNKAQSLPKVKLDFAACELAGIVSCFECGKKMVRQYSVSNYTKKDGSISKHEKEYLYCTDCAISVKYRSVEKQMIRILEEKIELSSDKLREEIGGNLNDLYKDESIDTDSILLQLETRKQTFQRRLERAREFLLDGTFTKEEFEAERSKARKELEDITKQIEYTKSISNEQANPSDKIDIEQVRGTIRTILDAYNRIQDKTRKNEILREVFDQVLLKRIQKAKNNREESKFELYVRFSYGVLT